MTDPATIFVFQCGNNYYGLTTQADGANLPPLSECEGPWQPLRALRQGRAELASYVYNVDDALSNLAARGYHLTHVHTDGIPPRARDHNR